MSLRSKGGASTVVPFSRVMSRSSTHSRQFCSLAINGAIFKWRPRGIVARRNCSASSRQVGSCAADLCLSELFLPRFFIASAEAVSVPAVSD